MRPQWWNDPKPKPSRLYYWTMFCVYPICLVLGHSPYLENIRWFGSIFAGISVYGEIQKARALGSSMWGLNAQDYDLACQEQNFTGWIAELRIMVADNYTGRDRGVISIQEGTFCFAGHSCSFVLGPQDIAPAGSFEGRGKFLAELGRKFLKFGIKHPLGKVAVEFRVLRSPAWDFESRQKDLKQVFSSFVHSAPSNAQRSYPPLCKPEAGPPPKGRPLRLR